jgi:hypothetical protein
MPGWTDDNIAPNCVNGDEHYTTDPGALAQFTFVGTQITLIVTKHTNRGQANVYIDGVFQTMIDEYSSTTLYQQAVYVKTGLSSGSHTIKIVCKGTKNAPTERLSRLTPSNTCRERRIDNN